MRSRKLPHVAHYYYSLFKCTIFSRIGNVPFSQTSGCSATAKGLKPGHLYQFEVSAINKEGQSEPIFTGDPILAENPYSEKRKIIVKVQFGNNWDKCKYLP